MIIGKAKIEYFENWCVAWMDKGLSLYYYSLIPKYYYANRQKYQTHITVVRKDVEKADMVSWRKYDGKVIKVTYSPVIQYSDRYFWLDAWSDDLIRLREELGLPGVRPPFKAFHITVGNRKAVP